MISQEIRDYIDTQLALAGRGDQPTSRAQQGPRIPPLGRDDVARMIEIAVAALRVSGPTVQGDAKTGWTVGLPGAQQAGGARGGYTGSVTVCFDDGAGGHLEGTMLIEDGRIISITPDT